MTVQDLLDFISKENINSGTEIVMDSDNAAMPIDYPHIRETVEGERVINLCGINFYIELKTED